MGGGGEKQHSFPLQEEATEQTQVDSPMFFPIPL